MRVGTMLSDIVKSFFARPVTQIYPVVRYEAPDRFRGKLIWNFEKCTGCGLCAKDCPSKAIEVIIVDRAKKQFVVRYHIDRCTFCAQCVQNCRFKCMQMSNNQWELASLTKEPFTIYYGNEANVDTVLDGFPPEDSAEPA